MIIAWLAWMTHDHPIEWVWFGVAAIDVWVSSSSWLAAHHDWLRAKRELSTLTPEQQLARAAQTGVTYAIDVSSRLNAFLAIMLCVSAILALFLPPPPPSYLFARQSLYVISILIAVSALNALIAIYGRLTRYRLTSGYFERYEKSRTARHKAAQTIADTYRKKVE